MDKNPKIAGAIAPTKEKMARYESVRHSENANQNIVKRKLNYQSDKKAAACEMCGKAEALELSGRLKKLVTLFEKLTGFRDVEEKNVNFYVMMHHFNAVGGRKLGRSRTKEMLDSTNLDTSNIIMSSIQEKIYLIEEAMGVVERDGDNSMVSAENGEDKKYSTNAKSLITGLNVDKLEGRLFPN
ncbi:transducin/WD40 repeat-like superfamily protein [Striga asiatica]|uniref:Transducin/WD40 repeat-like superfamily protein n=1 Tax=Striga asiatica TaxID=4170 RepID=A0A5A7R1L6_STRAF|nr:transducin/WD40 repeat-like superfamily protein [Striga asiatica]